MNGGTVRGEEKHKLARRSKREVCRRFRRVPVPPALTLSSVHKVDRQPSRSVTLLLGTNRRLSRGLRDGAAVPTNKFTFRELRVGQRVAHEGRPSLGTVIELGLRGVKVKWESGRTSYYRADREGNVPLKEPPAQ